MKTPIDNGTAGATIALLDSGAQFQMVDLWAITLNGGVVVYWHSGAMKTPLTFNGNTYISGPIISRGKISTKVGLSAATLEMNVSATLSDLINGSPVIPFAQGHGFDGATVVLYRGFLANWNFPYTIVGATIAFSGRVTSMNNMSRAKFTMIVSAWTVLLNVNMGPDVFQAGCLNNHYDANCGLAIITTGGLGASPPQNSWGGTVGVSPTPSQSSFELAGAAAAMADHYFDKGRILFTSGVNNGLLRTIQSNVGGVLNFAFGFPVAPSIGDTFTALRGCLLTLSDCKTQRPLLDAEEHYRGQLFTPPAITGTLGS